MHGRHVLVKSEVTQDPDMDLDFWFYDTWPRILMCFCISFLVHYICIYGIVYYILVIFFKNRCVCTISLPFFAVLLLHNVRTGFVSLYGERRQDTTSSSSLWVFAAAKWLRHYQQRRADFGVGFGLYGAIPH